MLQLSSGQTLFIYITFLGLYGLLQHFQTLIHSQSISQYSDSIIFSSIPFKPVKESTCTPELVQVSSEWDSKTLKLQLTSILPVTCYVPVLWPEL